MTNGQAPGFVLPTLEGGNQSLAELLSSGPLLLAFYKVTCPTCQLTFPYLERLHLALQRLQSERRDALRIVAISQDDADATARFNQKFRVTLTTLLDPRDRDGQRYPVSNAYGITNVPTLFLVEPDGRVAQSSVGFDKAEIERLGRKYGIEVFTATDRVPVYQPG